jgi:hypothetical protein
MSAPFMTRTKLIAAIAAALALAACHASEPRADQASCEVYRSFHATGLYPNMESVVVRRTSHRIIDAQGGTTAPPTRFFGGDVFTLQDFPPFIEHDSSAYFDQITSKPGADISICFPRNPPQFVDDDYRAPAGPPPTIGVWRLSPVAFSPDEQHALIAASLTCGDRCGQGTIYLFERQADSWSLVGSRDLWLGY